MARRSARGCGTGLAGQIVNEVVLLDFSKYVNPILELHPERRFARVQPGVVLACLATPPRSTS